MSAKILINGPASSGKTSLLRTLKDAFVVSRDGKNFPFKVPHWVIREFTDMTSIIYGATVKDEDGKEVYQEGVHDKLLKYEERNGQLPTTVVFDSVSKLYLDIIEYATTNVSKEWGQQGAHVTAEIGILNNYIQDTLVANGINVILLNHVLKDEESGYVSAVGMGKFANKGGFYSEVDHSILVVDKKVYTRGTQYQARSLLDDLPDMMYVEDFLNPSKSKKLKDGEEYYDLQKHIELITEAASEIADEYSY